MDSHFKNLVFSGAGILGIAYLGLLDYLYEHNLIEGFTRVAGTSAGAITASLVSLNLPFPKLKSMLNSLDYTKIPGKDSSVVPRFSSPDIDTEINRLFDNFDCVYRLIKKFGWYSSNYLYEWIKQQIATQFDASLKLPPYTFADFMDTSLHKDNRPFKELYIIGTDISHGTSIVFSYETTPLMEVAEAVRISMSIPLFFEAIQSTCTAAVPKTKPNIYSDGGLLYTYPITLFDNEDPPNYTLGSFIWSISNPKSINNLLDFISNIISCTTTIQYNMYKSNPKQLFRTIEINTENISPMDFNIIPNDANYNYLYNKGYTATENFFNNLPSL